MLALDQRESLRRMYPHHADDATLRRFKATAIATLTPYASAVLLDRPFAVTENRPPGIAPGCSLILAADELEQPPGSPVINTSLDPLITPEFIDRVGAVAIKFLVIWRPDGQSERARLVESFLRLAQDAGVASLVEGIVRPSGGEVWADAGARDEAIIQAAGELSALGGTIYKAEVPGYVPGDVSAVQAAARRLSEVVAGPWVVLSNGVEPADFAAAVRESCRGGAHGFLAGRAIWSDTVADPDPAGALAVRSTAKLTGLTTIVAEAVRS